MNGRCGYIPRPNFESKSTGNGRHKTHRPAFEADTRKAEPPSIIRIDDPIGGVRLLVFHIRSENNRCFAWKSVFISNGNPMIRVKLVEITIKMHRLRLVLRHETLPLQWHISRSFISFGRGWLDGSGR